MQLIDILLVRNTRQDWKKIQLPSRPKSSVLGPSHHYSHHMLELMPLTLELITINIFLLNLNPQRDINRLEVKEPTSVKMKDRLAQIAIEPSKLNDFKSTWRSVKAGETKSWIHNQFSMVSLISNLARENSLVTTNRPCLQKMNRQRMLKKTLYLKNTNKNTEINQEIHHHDLAGPDLINLIVYLQGNKIYWISITANFRTVEPKGFKL